uniref:Carboxypeptidase Q n=1 Tax=Electrophorus electricus TaxID=8005 RepID=A0A4W4F7R2_ELEEL
MTRNEQNLLFLTLVLICSLLRCHCKPLTYEGKLPEKISQILNYADIAQKIIILALYEKAQNRSYERFAAFTDTVGNRVSGSKNLDLAIKYIYNASKLDGLENVYLELVKIPQWVRGEESAVMVLPCNHSLSILGLGSSVGTPKKGIEAELSVVESFEELKRRANEAKGRIVVYNQPFVSYEETVAYRTTGASKAAKVGAVASLIMARMAHRGTRNVVQLTMGAQNLADVDSFNTVAEITGTEHPKQVVLLSGHLDSWDVGQGAMDDGGGVAISWEAMSLIKGLGLRPKSTLRTVLWSAEETGGMGAAQYYQQHKVANISNFDLVMESDLCTFAPVGLQFIGNDKVSAVMRDVMKLLTPINVTSLEEHGEGTDINMWMEARVPAASLHTADSKYFWFHHSQAVWDAVNYVVVDLDEMLPR